MGQCVDVAKQRQFMFVTPTLQKQSNYNKREETRAFSLYILYFFFLVFPFSFANNFYIHTYQYSKMSLTPEMTLGQPKSGKRKPGLRLTSKHLQPASSSSPSPNSSSSYLGTSQSNSRFREQIGNIVNGNNANGENYSSQPVEEEETSLAASYLQSTQPPSLSQQHHHHQQQQQQDIKNQDIPVLREAPLPPPSINTSQQVLEPNSHFMELKAEDLETLSRLGEGAAGTVRKVLHKPTQLVMAKKVCFVLFFLLAMEVRCGVAKCFNMIVYFH